MSDHPRVNGPAADGPGLELALRESRAVRRLVRLFRIERKGGFERWPITTVRRLVDRRARLLDGLDELETARRSLPESMPGSLPESMLQSMPGSLSRSLPAELGVALGELAGEIVAARQSCESRAARLAAELRQRRGRTGASGLRGSGAGQLLGQG
ncbi:MAG TPA: hypothetical protein VET89_07885 [Stellaceae bacterium]|nr:hypothetical protein [Stellaceae bacterium]